MSDKTTPIEGALIAIEEPEELEAPVKPDRLWMIVAYDTDMETGMILDMEPWLSMMDLVPSSCPEEAGLYIPPKITGPGVWLVDNIRINAGVDDSPNGREYYCELAGDWTRMDLLRSPEQVDNLIEACGWELGRRRTLTKMINDAIGELESGRADTAKEYLKAAIDGIRDSLVAENRGE